MDKMIMYFLNPAHTGKVTIALIVLVGVILLFLDYLTKVGFRNRYARAVPASARIIKLGHSIGNGTYGGRIVNITLEVIPTGAAPYEVKSIWCVEPLALQKVKAGDSLAIRIDAKDPKEIYSAEPWAWNLGKQLPLRFGNRIPIFYVDR